MTIPSNVTRNSYTGTGITGPYPVTFKFFEDADLRVTVADADGVETVKTLTTDYTVTGAGEQAGGSITFTTAVTNGYSIVIEPKADLTQDTDIKNEGGNLRESIEDRFDRLCRDDQVQQNSIDRSLKIKSADLLASTDLPVLEANGYLAVKTDRTGFYFAAASTATSVGAGTDISDAVALATGADTQQTIADHLSNIGVFPTGVGTEGRANEHTFLPARSALRCGGSDTTPTDNQNSYWVGLDGGNFANSWGDSDNIGLFSVAFNRNGAAYGTYSSAFGHDGVAYGVASMVGGASACTGNPASPNDGSGYCAFAFGKNVQAAGTKSAALNEETRAYARASLAGGYFSSTDTLGGSGIASISYGYQCQANGLATFAFGRECVADSPTQPGAGAMGYASSSHGEACIAIGREAIAGNADANSAAISIGYYTRAYGSYSIALGKAVTSTGGGIAIGNGVNNGSPLAYSGTGVGIGSNTTKPTITCQPGAGTSTDYGYASLSGKLELRGTVSSTGDDLPIAEIQQTSSGGWGFATVRVRRGDTGLIHDAWVFGSPAGTLSLSPANDAAQDLGSAAKRCGTIYASVGAINTSDEREKSDVSDIPESWLDAWADVKFSRFKMNVDKSGKWHVGVVAQRIVEAFDAHGIDALSTGIVVHDNWIDEDTGESRDRYGVRYDQALALECALMRRKLESIGA